MSLPNPDTLRHLRILEYGPELRAGVLDVCRSNVGGNFDESHYAIVEAYVDDAEKGRFLVAEYLDEIVACAALELDAARGVHVLCYGMVHHDFHRLGFGTLMLYARLALITDSIDPAHVWLETSPEAGSFYEQFGFRMGERVTDGYGPYRDSIHYGLELSVEARESIRRPLRQVRMELDARSG